MPTREDENSDLNPLCGGDPLARQLAALQPMPAGLNREQLLYAAGAAARDRDVAFWKRLFAGQCAAVVAFVGVGLTINGWDGTDSGRSAGVSPALPGGSSDLTPTEGSGAGGTPTLRPERAPLPIPHSEFRGPHSGGFASASADELPPGERAKWLQLRADIFAAGLGVLPTPAAPPPRADATALEKSLHLPPGVLAAPHQPAPKKKLTAEDAEGAERNQSK